MLGVYHIDRTNSLSVRKHEIRLAGITITKFEVLACKVGVAVPPVLSFMLADRSE